MDPREEGWPLGLRLIGGRVGMVGRSRDFNGSISFSTLVTGSPTSSTASSSDLDTESTTGSFFNDNSITLGSLMGASSILHLSRRSSTGRRATEALRNHKTSSSSSSFSYKPIIRPTWLFSLCPRLTTDAVTTTNAAAPSLGHFLQAERRAAATIHRRNMSPQVLSNPTLSSLFLDGRIAPSSRPQLGEDGGGRRSMASGLQAGGVYGSSPIFSRLCGQPIGSS